MEYSFKVATRASIYYLPDLLVLSFRMPPISGSFNTSSNEAQSNIDLNQIKLNTEERPTIYALPVNGIVILLMFLILIVITIVCIHSNRVRFEFLLILSINTIVCTLELLKNWRRGKKLKKILRKREITEKVKN